jgi:hypothetical protein
MGWTLNIYGSHYSLNIMTRGILLFYIADITQYNKASTISGSKTVMKSNGKTPANINE